MTSYIVTATGTNVGKTLISALLMRALRGYYWKPVQTGAEETTDTETVKALTELPDAYFFPETYCLTHPLSPHRAAELNDVEIDIARILTDYQNNLQYAAGQNLIIESAGGPLVPVTRQVLQIDLFKQMNAPLILVSHTGLGTINHTLLSIEAIRARNLPLHGIIFTGPDNPDNVRTIAEISQAKILGWLPQLPAVTPKALDQTFAQQFNRANF